MSIQAVSWVLDKSRAELGARLALISIANHADRSGQNSYPSFTTIGAEARMSRRSAIDAVRRLEADKHIRVEKGAGPRRENVYEIVGMAPDPSEVSSPPSFRDGEVDGEADSEANGEAGSEADSEVRRIPSFKEPFNHNRAKSFTGKSNLKTGLSEGARFPDWSEERRQFLESIAEPEKTP